MFPTYSMLIKNGIGFAIIDSVFRAQYPTLKGSNFRLSVRCCDHYCYNYFQKSIRMSNSFENIFDFTTAGDWDCVAAVERLPALHYSVDFIFLSFGIMDFIVGL